MDLPYKLEDNLDPQKMNRIIRHRLRNLSAGVKMTIDRIAEVTASTHPQLVTRCKIINAEFENLETFTDRMDLLFDNLPKGNTLTLKEIITTLGNIFKKNFPFCDLALEGEEVDIHFIDGNLLLIALTEILLNAGEGVSSDGFVKMVWKKANNSYSFIIINPGYIDSEIPINPPQPFNTLKGRHDGIGLAIANRICKRLKVELLISSSEGNVIVQFKIPAEEWRNE